MATQHKLNYALKDFMGWGLTSPTDASTHLQAAAEWICRAQDATPDDGVARMYDLRKGWGPSYPETTGYIIPTMLDCGKYFGNGEYKARALRMAHWEVDVQLPDGAVQGGMIDAPRVPAMFNTGQVIFGWCAAYRESNDTRFLQALTRAADFMVSSMDPDGAWRKNLGLFAHGELDEYAYNIRAAWALLIASALTGNENHRTAAGRNLGHVLDITQTNGWTAKNCLTDANAPLLHTIAYTLQGVLEAGVIVNEPRALHTVLTASGHLLNSLERSGTLSGRYNAEWSPTVRWRCLTGEAQMAITWFRLAQLTGDARWRRAALQINDGLKRLQMLAGPAEIVGAIKGSYPVYRDYGRYEYLNWATKFFMDAQLLELGVEIASVGG